MLARQCCCVHLYVSINPASRMPSCSSTVCSYCSQTTPLPAPPEMPPFPTWRPLSLFGSTCLTIHCPMMAGEQTSPSVMDIHVSLFSQLTNLNVIITNLILINYHALLYGLWKELIILVSLFCLPCATIEFAWRTVRMACLSQLDCVAYLYSFPFGLPTMGWSWQAGQWVYRSVCSFRCLVSLYTYCTTLHCRPWSGVALCFPHGHIGWVPLHSRWTGSLWHSYQLLDQLRSLWQP